MRSGPLVRTVESVNPGGSSSWRLAPRQATMGDFDPYASMAEWQRGVVEPFAQMSGIPPGTVLFTFALWASLPLGAVFQLIPWPTLKNVYSFVSGASPVRRDQISIVHVDRAPNASEEFVQRDRAYPRDLAPDDPSDDPSKRTKRTNPEPKTSRLALSPSPPR